MKPHEIIEKIVKTTCRAYMLSLNQVMDKEKRVTTNNAHNKNIREARIIIACMVEKYLGENYVYDVLGVSRDIMGAYKTAHKAYMFRGNCRVYEITHAIYKLFTIVQYSAAPQLEKHHKTWH